jgi:predicted ATPase
MPGYILTGTPGAGKTAILRLLEISGHQVVEEAATDVIALGHALGRAEPWHDPDFSGKVLALQQHRWRERAGAAQSEAVFFDRSPVCTLALGRYLGSPACRALARDVGVAMAEAPYDGVAFFVRNQGFIQPTAARRISFEDSLLFEQILEQTYRDLGFRLAYVPAGPLADRAALIQQTVRQLAGG